METLMYGLFYGWNFEYYQQIQF